MVKEAAEEVGVSDVVPEMVERVARAICRHSCDGEVHVCDKASDGTCKPEKCRFWRLQEEAARAAIEAMREPNRPRLPVRRTEAMSEQMHLDFRPDEGPDASILDEFVITGAHGIHAEMMNDSHLWIGIENQAGHLVHVNIWAERKGNKLVLRMRAEDQGVHLRKPPPAGWVAVPDRIAELEAENRELKMQAIADHAQFQEAVERLPDVTDPIAVHRNMLAGTIAKPSVEAIIHVYGHKALNAALRETDGVPPPALTDTKPKGSETP